MAEIIVYEIEFLQNNTAGTFLKGDVLSLYLDDATITTSTTTLITTGVVAKRNGTPIGSGPAIDILRGDIRNGKVSIKEKMPLVCITTSKVAYQLGNTHPYLSYRTEPGSVVCSASSPSCDLIISGVPVVVNASSDVANDGSITISATSSNSIEYKNGADFTYGNGQASGTFTGLATGTYTIFIRDSVNCGANITVSVGVDNSYGVKYRLEYDDNAGFLTRIDILERLYSDGIIEICGADTPFTIDVRAEGSNDKFEPLLSLQANLNLTSLTEQQFVDLYTNDRRRYKINYYKNNVLKLSTNLLPFIYAEDYKSAPYYVSFTSTDGLPELNNISFFNVDGLKFTGKQKLIKLISYCLKRTLNPLPIRVGCNLYAQGMNSTATDDPLDQAYVDVEAFYIAEERPSLDFVLRSILEAFGARIMQWGGYWNIVRVEEMGNSYDYRQFSVDGDYVSNGTYNPLVDIEFPTSKTAMLQSFPVLELRPGYGEIVANYRLGLKENFFNNGDFSLSLGFRADTGLYHEMINHDGFDINSSNYPMYTSHEVIEDDNVALVLSHDDVMITANKSGLNFIQSKDYNVAMGLANKIKFKFRYKISRVERSWIDFPYIKIRVIIQWFRSPDTPLYLRSDGEWTTTLTSVEFFADKVNQYIESEVVASKPYDNTGYIDTTVPKPMFVKVFHATPYYADYTTVASMKALVTVGRPNGYKITLRDTANYPSSADTLYYYELEEHTAGSTFFQQVFSGYDVIVPDDYNNTTNPRCWMLKYKKSIHSGSNGATIWDFCIDKISAQFLTGNESPIDTIIRKGTGELNNPEVYSKDFFIGSDSGITVTEYVTPIAKSIRGGLVDAVWINGVPKTLQATNILSAQLIYTGWLRKSDDTPFDIWTRDNVEEEKLHGIWIKSAIHQYGATWRLFRGSVISKTQLISPFCCFVETNDSDRRYLPISGTLNDKMNSFDGEMHELNTVGIYDVTFKGDFDPDLFNFSLPPAPKYTITVRARLESSVSIPTVGVVGFFYRLGGTGSYTLLKTATVGVQPSYSYIEIVANIDENDQFDLYVVRGQSLPTQVPIVFGTGNGGGYTGLGGSGNPYTTTVTADATVYVNIDVNVGDFVNV